MSDAGACPSEDAIVALVERTLRPEALAPLEHHLDTCSVCRRVVAELVVEHAGEHAGVHPQADEDDDDADDEPEIGARLGRFRVIGRLGEGGMGRVLLAEDPRLQRRVAIKRLRPEHDDDDGARALREARAAARLVHEHVQVVLDVGRERRRVWIAFEWVDGVSLDRWLQQPRTRRRVLEVLLAAGRGLAAAHEAGVVHRDVKPANILVGDDGRVCVADFGLAIDRADGRALAEHDATAPGGGTPVTTPAGTPAYLAPELLRGARADPRSDQYAWFVMLLEALTGARPHAGASTQARLLAARTLPRRLRRVLAIGLAELPARRFTDMHAALAAVHRAAARPWRSAAAIAAAVAVIGLVLPRPGAAPTTCRDRARAIEADWNPAHAQALQARLAPLGPELAGRVSRGFDDAAQRWIAQVEAACDGGTIADARLSCLERTRGGFVALREGLAGPSDELDALARWSLRRLEGLEPCDDDPVQPQPAAADAARSAQLLALAARLRFAEQAGPAALAAGVASVDAIARQDRRGGLEAGVERARALLDLGAHEPAIARLQASYDEAIAQAQDDVAANAAIVLVGALGHDLHRFDEAERWAGHARAAIERLSPHLARRMASSLAERLGSMAAERDRPQEALRWHDEALGFAEATGDVDGVIENLRNRGHALRALGRTAQAEADYRRAIAIADENLGVAHPWTASVQLGLAAIMLERREPTAARAVIESALAALQRAHGRDHVDVAVAWSYLGEALSDEGRPREALAAYREALRIDRTVFGDRHTNVAISRNNVAEVLVELGELAAARDEYALALDIKVAALGEDHPSVMLAHDNLAVALDRLGQPGALAHYEAALAIADRVLGPDDPRRASVLQNLAEHRRLHGEPARAIPSYERALALLQARHGAQHPLLAYPLTGLAQAQLAHGTPLAGLAAAERAVALRQADDVDAALRAASTLALAEILHALGRDPDRVRALAAAAADSLADRDDPDAPARARALARP